ncbi:Major Facilitator Superfamily protein [Aphelenchoides bicaudatus]|nr:Major Facilitator Superfamily protein [Aphelenchoides bicaudatus]
MGSKLETSTSCTPRNGYRFVVLALTALCLTSICSNMIAFNVTMLCMDDDVQNSTDIQSSMTDSEKTKRNSILIWAVSIGSILSTFPFNIFYSRFGARYVFLGAGLISMISTALLPLASMWGMAPFIVVRFLQGVAFAANFACIGMVTSRWACLDENGFFLSAMTNFSQISVILTNPITGALCDSSWGWHSAYYLHAALGPLLFGAWIVLYTDYPEQHKWISSAEKEKIMYGKNKDHRKLDGFVPYMEICKNRVILIVWFNAFGDIISAIFLLTYFPTYLTSVLKYPLQTAAVLSMLPAISHIPTKLAFGWVFDKTTFMTEVNKMRICNTIALAGSAICFIIVGFIPDELAWLSVTITTINYAFIGANCSGFYKCGSLVSRQYSHFVIANIQFLKCISLFVSPLMVWIFVSDTSSRQQWHIIYIIMGSFLIVANFLFCYYVTDEPADFTQITKTSKRNAKTIVNN